MTGYEWLPSDDEHMCDECAHEYGECSHAPYHPELGPMTLAEYQAAEEAARPWRLIYGPEIIAHLIHDGAKLLREIKLTPRHGSVRG